MAITMIEEHVGERTFYIRLRFTAATDVYLQKFPSPQRNLSAQANILPGGNLTAFSVTITKGLNPTILPNEAGVVATVADNYVVDLTDTPFNVLYLVNSGWTGSSTLEVVIAGVS
jgi:hypothetical protein